MRVQRSICTRKVAEDLDRCSERRHLRLIAGRLKQLQEVVERALIEGSNHCLRDVRKQMVHPETRARKRIYPVAFEQAADDELQQELG